MKKLTAAILILVLLFANAAMAAGWTNGRSAAQPYAGVPAMDLTKTMGYVVLYPHTKLPAGSFCGALEIYLPREDVALNKGVLRVYDNAGDEAVEIVAIDFAESEGVEIRALDEGLLDRLMWGGGVCVRILLPKSLEFAGEAGHKYYVLMDEGCFTAANGAVVSPAISNPEAWVVELTAEFGVSGLYYAAPVEAAAVEYESADWDEEVEATEAPEVEEVEPEIHLIPEVGDTITFELVMGGAAKTAVIFSENDSVRFDEIEFTESGTITGEVTKADVDWGVVFLDANGNTLQENGQTSGIVYLGR